MPKMKDEEMKSAVRFEAEKIIPFNLNDCIIDYHVIADTPGGKSDLILVAAKDGYVRDLIGTVEECGFTVRVVDVDSLAVINAFSRYKKDLAVDKGIALVNIGAKSTNLAIIHGGAVCFIRDLASAGNDFSASVSRSLNIDASSAEDIKISPNEKMQAVINAVRQTLGDLSDDIKLSFNYYENQSGHGVDEIYLSGGSAALAGIEAFFQESFGVVPFFWNPLEPFSATGGMAGAKETTAMSGSFGVAAGLALR
jgi:type IV pilus assembly protein PilM